MSIVSLLFSRHGRLARRPFAIAAICVYLAGFLSQVLLSGSVTWQAGPWPFAAVQAVLVWIWFVLHGKRLRDAGRPAGMAAGIACLYALAVLLFLLVIAMITAGETSSEAARTGQGLLRLVAVIWVIGLLLGHGDLGMFGYWLAGFVVLLILPALIAFVFSIRTALRPSVP
jgi:uncharacterized membrane protein YhaH (DUF805 family)